MHCADCLNHLLRLVKVEKEVSNSNWGTTLGLTSFLYVGKIAPMKEFSLRIGKARRDVKKVRAGVRVKKLWRVAVPSDSKLFGDLQSPVMAGWK